MKNLIISYILRLTIAVEVDKIAGVIFFIDNIRSS